MTAITNANQTLAKTVEALSDAQLDALAAGSFGDFLRSAVDVSANVAKTAIPALLSIF